MAIFTAKSRVNRALDFYAEESIWWGLGGQTPWPTSGGKEVPDQPGISDTISDIFVYKKNTSKYMVRPIRDGEDKSNTVAYRGSYWKIVDPEHAQDEGARWVYVGTNLEYSEISTASIYRKIGLFTGFESSSSNSVCLPEEVVDEGTMEVLEYRNPVYRSDDQREVINVILEF